jgi:L-ascorbate metabolism protein UlaG (beta-lactamase superfamily)
VKRVLSFLAVLAVVAPAWLAYRWNDRPSLEPYRNYFLPSAPAEARGIRVTFLGVSTLLLDDGETAILVDGFFSRPGVVRSLASRIEPDVERVEKSLARAGIDRLAAVITVHSHYDHAMDAPLVAERTGAILVGSESTANIARGWGLAEERIRVVGGETHERFGRFQVTLIPAAHFPHGMAMGEIHKPLVTPARAVDYKEGGSYSLIVEHDDKTLLVQGSAGFVPGRLRGRHADVVFLGTAGLGTREDEYRDAYWREVVTAVGARRVIAIHWDDFTRPLDEPLVPLSRLLDDVPLSFDFFIARAAAEKIDFKLVAAWSKIDPFAGL